MSKIKSLDDMAAFIIAENNKLTEQISSIQIQLTMQIKEITEQFNNKIEAVTKDNAVLRTRINELEELQSRQERSKQLVIRNLPVLGDEKLQTIFKNISDAVNFDVSACKGFHIYRLLPKTVSSKRVLRSNVSSGPSQSSSKVGHYPIVIVQFLAEWDKSTFLHKYLNCIKSAGLNHSMLGIGLTSNSRIYIGENLTKKNHEIFIKCAMLKVSGKIAQYYTRNGIVYARKSMNSSAAAILSLDSLLN